MRGKSPMDDSQTASSRLPYSRREFIKRSAAAAALPTLSGSVEGRTQGDPSQGKKSRPNIIVYIADQFRWDCVSAYGLNPMQVTPNLDGVAARGVAFQNAVTNQPLCSPSRACLFTGMYATQTGVWTLTDSNVGMKP